jgi:hypothetical protein
MSYSQFNSTWRTFLLGLTLFLLQKAALALPVGFKDSWMTMGEVGKDYQDTMLIYNFGQKTAVGFGITGQQWKHGQGTSAMHTRRYEMLDVHLNHRLARWNMPEAQANIYVLGGIGSLRTNYLTNTQTALLPGLQLDYETRRVYAALKWHGTYTDQLNTTRTSLAGGFSFFKTDYDEWQPWLILEASRMGGDLKDAHEITPYFRLIHKTLFIEAGAPFKRGKSEGLKVNFRYTF